MPAIRLLELILALLGLAGFLLYLYRKDVRRRLMEESATTWPATSAMLIDSAVYSVGAGDSLRFVLDLTYAYSANGKPHDGFHSESFAGETDAREMLAALGNYPLLVHYDPSHPEFSCLDLDQDRAPSA